MTTDADLTNAPSLCDSTECLGCGSNKGYVTYVCCQECFHRMPVHLCDDFLRSRSFGVTIAERRVAVWLAEYRKNSGR
jgi:hypothetical protein